MYSPMGDSDSDSDSSSSSSSCSHWWHVPFYLASSFTLAFIAISTGTQLRLHSPHITPPLPPSHALAFNASRALRLRGGFHITAALLQISPALFLSSPQTTLFAIQDSAISNLSIPLWTMRHLLRYHVIPATLPTAELFKKPPGFCFETLLHGQELAITKNDDASLMINDVLVSHPDMFLEGPLAVHGVDAPFDTAASPSCRVSGRSSLLAVDDWTRIVRGLSSNGFVSFAIGLNAVLDGILQDYPNLESVTVLAPPNSDLLSSPSPFLDRIVRLHILPQRFSYADLEMAAAQSSSLRTLVPGSAMEIKKLSQSLAVNGVQITRPNVFSSSSFIIHGVSRDFDLEEFFSSFK